MSLTVNRFQIREEVRFNPMNGHMFKRIATKIIFASCMFSILSLSSSMAQTGRKIERKEILAIGTSVIEDGNIAMARETAISEALFKGVEEYLSRQLGSQGMINNFPRLIHDIIPAAKEEIENFHILAEDRTDQYYRILVRLKVNEKVMEERLREIGLVLVEGPPIKILFLVSQDEPRKGKIFYWWKDPENDSELTHTDLILHRVFQERGFSPINRLSIVPEENVFPHMKVLDLSYEDAIQWGKVFAADVVIQGKCTVIAGEKLSVNLRAIDTEQGLNIGRGSRTERIDENLTGMEQIMLPLERAINKVAAQLGPRIIRAAELHEMPINQIEVAIQGFRTLREPRQIQNFLRKDIAGVKSVRQSRITGQAIFLVVEFAGDEDKLLEMVSNHEKKPIRTDVSKSEEGKIIINLR
jgi:hypothetical protein